jgi:hypothetical protein
MTIVTRYALTIGAAVLISGCGSSQPPVAEPNVNAQVNPITSYSARGGDLLYVADTSGDVQLVSYPAGKKVGSIYYGLYSFIGGECSDRSGNVWITDYSGIAEYPHGGTKPITQKFARWDLTGCSVAPKSNDVAAAGQMGTVFIWSGGRGRARTYHTKSFYTLRYCGYDADGNLFVDGFEQYNRDKFLLFELPSGERKLTSVSLDQKIHVAGQVQWDGRYLAIQDEGASHSIYQIKVSGNIGTVVNKIAFQGLRKPVKASWIAGSTIFVPYSAAGRFPNAIGIFNYPGGGKPIDVLRGGAYRDVGAVTLSR